MIALNMAYIKDGVDVNFDQDLYTKDLPFAFHKKDKYTNIMA